MQVFAFILAFQVILSAVFLSLSPGNATTQTMRHSANRVLGASLLADDTNPTDTPTDTPTNTPTETPTDVPMDTSTPIPTTTETGSESAVPTATQIISPEGASDTPIPEMSPAQGAPPAAALVNPADVVASPEMIDQAVLNQAQKEDQTLQGATNPQSTIDLLTHFSDGAVTNISNSVTAQDFSTTSYVVQRLLSHVDRAQTIIDKGHATPQGKQKLTEFCKQADFTLKTQQLVVPEDLEQDIEIARGNCLTTQ